MILGFGRGRSPCVSNDFGDVGIGKARVLSHNGTLVVLTEKDEGLGGFQSIYLKYSSV